MIFANLGLFPIPRVYRRRRDPFTELGGDEFRAGFRLSKDTVLHLLSEVGFICRMYLFTFLSRRYSWPILVLIRLECCGREKGGFPSSRFDLETCPAGLPTPAGPCT